MMMIGVMMTTLVTFKADKRYRILTVVYKYSCPSVSNGELWRLTRCFVDIMVGDIRCLLET